jgi:hypothetical protein
MDVVEGEGLIQVKFLPIDCDQTVMGLPPIMSAVFLIAKSFFFLPLSDKVGSVHTTNYFLIITFRSFFHSSSLLTSLFFYWLTDDEWYHVLLSFSY